MLKDTRTIGNSCLCEILYDLVFDFLQIFVERNRTENAERFLQNQM